MSLSSRIANGVKTLLRAAVREELTAQREAVQKDVRALCEEMGDVLESFSAVMRREAARRARDLAAEIRKRGEGESAPAGDGATGQQAPASPEEEKAQLRRLLAHGGTAAVLGSARRHVQLLDDDNREVG